MEKDPNSKNGFSRKCQKKSDLFSVVGNVKTVRTISVGKDQTNKNGFSRKWQNSKHFFVGNVKTVRTIQQEKIKTIRTVSEGKCQNSKHQNSQNDYWSDSNNLDCMCLFFVMSKSSHHTNMTVVDSNNLDCMCLFFVMSKSSHHQYDRKKLYVVPRCHIDTCFWYPEKKKGLFLEY